MRVLMLRWLLDLDRKLDQVIRTVEAQNKMLFAIAERESKRAAAELEAAMKHKEGNRGGSNSVN
jgi:hypothetical protein